MMFVPLPEGANVTAKSLEHFLQSLLADNCDRIWYCPYITGFIDEQTPSKLKVIQVANITKQVIILRYCFFSGPEFLMTLDGDPP
jgi:hypothetical protein